MSRLSELIRDLCPDGVDKRPLGELLAYTQPGPYLVSSKQYSPRFSTPVLTAGTTFLLGYSREIDGVYEASKSKPVIIFDDFTTDSKWVDFPFKLKSSATKILTLANSQLADIRFLFYLLQTIRYQVGTHSRHWISRFAKMPVFCPPLEVQQEIVRILDQFTTLEARKAQYSYYRDSLFARRFRDFRVETQWVPLGDLGEFIRGNGLQKSEFVREGQPAIHYGQIHTIFGVRADRAAVYVAQDRFDSLKKAFPGDLLIATTSEDDDAVAKAVAWVGSGAVAVSGDMYIYRSGVDNRYMSHFFASRCFQRQKRPYVTGTKVRRISAAGLSKVLVPLVDRNEQLRVADILDRFDALVNDISTGLPAEIASRRKQYEHYRDRLLSFPEKEV